MAVVILRPGQKKQLLRVILHVAAQLNCEFISAVFVRNADSNVEK